MTSDASSGHVAAVDLGSNSFHMVIARLVEGRLEVVDRMRERVQLAAGLSDDGVAPAAEARALACLAQFGRRLAGIPSERVRAVGTYTFRRAQHREAFLARCERALGHAIEVLSGREEARILFRGVSSALPARETPRLVVDIGGGSTECILGIGEKAQRMDSLEMGCVSYSERFFPDGTITHEHFRRASLSARRALAPVEGSYRGADFVEAIGSSGTIGAIAGMLSAQHPDASGITLAGIASLRDAAVARGHVERLDLPGLQPDRRSVIMGGLAILHAVFEAFAIERPMIAAKAALREGLLLELQGRLGVTSASAPAGRAR